MDALRCGIRLTPDPVGDGMPEPDKSPDMSIAWQLLYTLAFVAVICVLGFKNSKREQMN